MKKLITFLLALVPMIAAAQQDKVTGTVWCNASQFFVLNHVAGKPNFINGQGGTLHEGGVIFGLKGSGNDYKVVEGDNGEPVGSEYYYSGQNLVFNAKNPTAKQKKINGQRYLLVYDGNELLDIYHEFIAGITGDGWNTIYDLEESLQNDIVFAGEYIDSKGDLVTFSKGERSVTGLFGGKKSFEIKTVYDSPSEIIQFSDGTAYSIKHEDDGLLLTKMDISSEDTESWESTNSTIKLYHVLPANYTGASGKTSRFDFASENVLYSGILGWFTKKELQLMRNEIYARHGYQFSTPEMKEYFSRCPWYSPRGNNNAVVAELSETEQLNIQQIKRAEKEANE